MFHKIVIVFIILLNCASYVVMWFDKYRSKKNGWRVRERSLFLMAFLWGAPGIYLGMQAPLYHKAAKPGFKYGIPLLILVNLVTVYWLLSLKK
ncbi:MAG: DUF1294 domain-containing protein [Bacteroidota bacterium]